MNIMYKISVNSEQIDSSIVTVLKLCQKYCNSSYGSTPIGIINGPNYAVTFTEKQYIY